VLLLQIYFADITLSIVAISLQNSFYLVPSVVEVIIHLFRLGNCHYMHWNASLTHVQQITLSKLL
jgi:hypothetical protein